MRNSKTSQKMEILPQMQHYRHCQQPLLSDEKKISIQQKLQLEKQAVHNARNRQTNVDYYIKFNYNPFMQYRGRDGSMMQQYLKNNKKNIVNIVDKMTQMKISQIPIKPRIQQKSAQFKQQKIAYSMFSDKILNKIQKQASQANPDQAIKSVIAERRQNLHRTKSATIIKPAKKPQLMEKRANQQKNMQNMQIQTLVTTKQENFFLKHMKKINIFKLARGQDDQVSSRQLLKKMHFCQNSTVQKISKLKIPIYRDISALGRRVLVQIPTGHDNIIDFVDSYELSFKLKQLIFHDVMSVASNRLSPQFLNKMFNYDETTVNKQQSDASSQQQQDVAIIYRKNQRTKQNNFINQNQEMQQINDYMNLRHNQPQGQYDRSCFRRKQKIVKKLQLRKDLVRRTVKDQQLHRQIGIQVQQHLKSFVNMSQQRSIFSIDADRLVRQNKIFKTKKDTIKLKSLIQTLATKNKHQQILRGKSKSPSPLAKAKK